MYGFGFVVCVLQGGGRFVFLGVCVLVLAAVGERLSVGGRGGAEEDAVVCFACAVFLWVVVGGAYVGVCLVICT